jgi:peptide/nickel transport system permease protein
MSGLEVTTLSEGAAPNESTWPGVPPIWRSPVTCLALGWIVLITAASLAAPLIAPYGATQTDLLHLLSGPNSQHWLGTDQLGRDVLSRLLYGGDDALFGVAEATIAFVVVGVTLGVLAGYYGRWIDWLVTRWIEITVALPGILILLVILAVFANNESAAMVAFGILAAPGLARVTRGETLRTREQLYVAAARISGASDWQILRRHIVRRLTTTIIVQAFLLAAVALIVQAGLAYLGLGVQEPAPSWGGMVNEAGQVVDNDPWLLIPSGGVIALTVLALGLVGDGLRDAAAAQWSAGTGGRTRRRRQSKPKPSSGLQAGETLPADALLVVRGLTVGFDAERGSMTVVQGVDLELRAGETLGIVGESGCGKSVTAAALLGILPANAEVSAELVSFDGIDLLSSASVKQHQLRGKRIAYVSQEPMTALDPTARIGSLLAEAVRVHRGCSRQEARAVAVQLLERVRIKDPADAARRYPHQISGGQAQRVAIALALAGEPDLLIADEPTTALDVTVQAEILALLRQLQAEMSLAIILITHDWGVAASICARVAVMYAGQVVEYGDTDQLFHEPAHPYTIGLLAANPHRVLSVVADGGTLPARLPAIAGTVPPPALWPRSCHFQDRCPLFSQECAEAPILMRDLSHGHGSRCLHIDETPALRVAS